MGMPCTKLREPIGRNLLEQPAGTEPLIFLKALTSLICLAMNAGLGRATPPASQRHFSEISENQWVSGSIDGMGGTKKTLAPLL